MYCTAPVQPVTRVKGVKLDCVKHMYRNTDPLFSNKVFKIWFLDTLPDFAPPLDSLELALCPYPGDWTLGQLPVRVAIPRHLIEGGQEILIHKSFRNGNLNIYSIIRP